MFLPKPNSSIFIIKSESLMFPAGDYLYDNNYGHFILGAIIGKISGMKYGDFLHAHIFLHLKMGHSLLGNHSF